MAPKPELPINYLHPALVAPLASVAFPPETPPAVIFDAYKQMIDDAEPKSQTEFMQCILKFMGTRFPLEILPKTKSEFIAINAPHRLFFKKATLLLTPDTRNDLISFLASIQTYTLMCLNNTLDDIEKVKAMYSTCVDLTRKQFESSVVFMDDSVQIDVVNQKDPVGLFQAYNAIIKDYADYRDLVRRSMNFMAVAFPKELLAHDKLDLDNENSAFQLFQHRIKNEILNHGPMYKYFRASIITYNACLLNNYVDNALVTETIFQNALKQQAFNINQ